VMQGDRERCLNVGMNDYLAKPVSPAAVSEMLEKWLPAAVLSKGRETDFGKPAPVAPEPAAETDPVFDREGFLSRVMGDGVLARRILEIFVEDMPRQIESLKGMVRRTDLESSIAKAHHLKGACANVGGMAMHRVARRMEGVDRIEDIAELVTEFETQFIRFTHRIGELG
jgi:two-component system, sensor histidine kinase and response regulator